MPCTADVYSRYILDGYSSEESADNGDVSEGAPGLRFGDYNSNWFILGTKVLDYLKD
jgi:hypothetical protein